MDKKFELKLKEMHPGVAEMDATYDFYVEYDGKVIEDCRGAEFYLLCSDKDIKINGNQVIVPYSVRQEQRPVTVHAELCDFIGKAEERVEASDDYTLEFKTVFSDEPTFFDDFETLDTSVWSDGSSFTYTFRRNTHGYIEGSDLVFKMTLDDPCKMAHTAASFTQTFGSFSARIKFPEYSSAPNACNCAFWLCSNCTKSDEIMWNRNPESKQEKGSDHAGEIDIIEYSPAFGDYGTCALHYNGWGPYLKSTGKGGIYMPAIREGYHVISLVWEPDHLYWYYDGRLFRSYTGPGIIGAGREEGGDMVVLLQSHVQWEKLETGRAVQTWYGRGIEESFPQEMRTDWVRVHSIK